MSTTIHYVYIVSVLENCTFTNKFLNKVKKLVKFVLPSPVVPLRSTDKALAANFASGMGPCTGIFKHLLRVTTHPQFLVLAWDNTVYSMILLSLILTSFPQVPV